MKTIPLVGCVILDDQSRLLVIHRNTERLRQWELPGGKVEAGETFEQAVQREAREEIGAEISVGRELGQTDFVDNGVNWEYHWFSAVIISGEATIGEPDRCDGIMYADLMQDDFGGDTISPNLINLRQALAAGKVELS